MCNRITNNNKSHDINSLNSKQNNNNNYYKNCNSFSLWNTTVQNKTKMNEKSLFLIIYFSFMLFVTPFIAILIFKSFSLWFSSEFFSSFCFLLFHLFYTKWAKEIWKYETVFCVSRCLVIFWFVYFQTIKMLKKFFLLFFLAIVALFCFPTN